MQRNLIKMPNSREWELCKNACLDEIYPTRGDGSWVNAEEFSENTKLVSNLLTMIKLVQLL